MTAAGLQLFWDCSRVAIVLGVFGMRRALSLARITVFRRSVGCVASAATRFMQMAHAVPTAARRGGCLCFVVWTRENNRGGRQKIRASCRRTV